MIDLKNIHFEGFRSFQTPTTFQLDRGGIVIIRGQNGVGKTTIFDGLMWVFYGILTKDVPKDRVEPWDNIKREDHRGVRGWIEFEKGGKRYDVARHYKFKGETKGYKGNSGLLIFEDGSLRNEELQKKDSEAFLEGILGVSSKVFLRSILFGQRMSSLVKEADSKKREILEEIFDTLYIPKAKEEAQKDLRTISDRITDHGTKIDKKTSEKDSLKESIEEAQSIVEQFEERRKKEIEAYKEEIEAKEKEIREFREEKDPKEDKLAKVKEELEGMRSTDSLNEKKEDVQKEIDDLDEKIEARKNTVRKESEEYERVKEAKEKAEKEERKAQERTQDLKEEIEKADRKITDLEEEKEGLDLSCGICGKDLSDHYESRIKEYDEKIRKEKEAKEELEEQLKTAQETENKATKERQKQAESFAQYEKPQDPNEDGKVKTIREKRDVKRGELNGYKEEIKRIERDREPKEKEKKELSERIEELKTKIEKANEAVQNRKQDIEKKKEEEPPSVDIEGKKKKKQGLEEEIEELEDKASEERDRYKYIAWWVEKGFSSSGLKAYIFQRMLERLNNRMRKYAEKLGALVRLKVDMEKKSKPFYTEVWMGEQQVLYEDLSGGQQQRVDIVMAFACHDIIADQGLINILAMDEIFEGLDDEGIESVFELVREKKGEGTIYIITHLKEVTTTGAQELKIQYNGRTRSSEIV